MQEACKRRGKRHARGTSRIGTHTSETEARATPAQGPGSATAPPTAGAGDGAGNSAAPPTAGAGDGAGNSALPQAHSTRTVDASTRATTPSDAASRMHTAAPTRGTAAIAIDVAFLDLKL